MALVCKPGLLGDPSEGLVGPAHQGSCALEATLHDITLRPNPDCLLKGAAEVIGERSG